MHRILLVARLPTQMIIYEHPIARVYARLALLWPGAGQGSCLAVTMSVSCLPLAKPAGFN
jgi:hypothetical protein